MAERDWYDRFTLVFQVSTAVIAGLFTIAQYERNSTEQNQAQAAQERADATNRIEKAVEDQRAIAQNDENKRAIITKFLFDAITQAASSDPDQQKRGQLLVKWVDTDLVLNSLGVQRTRELEELIGSAQNYKYSAFGAFGQNENSGATKQIAPSSCSDRLIAHHAAGTRGATAPDCWIYLGWYKGDIAGGQCVHAGTWWTHYLDFVANQCPVNLKSLPLTVSARTGALYVRSAPATEAGVAQAVGGLYPGQQVEISEISSSITGRSIDQNSGSPAGQGQIWGRISSIK